MLSNSHRFECIIHKLIIADMKGTTSNAIEVQTYGKKMFSRLFMSLKIVVAV